MQIGNQIITFNHVENIADSRQTDFFFSVLANPEKVSPVQAEKLEMLVKAYPQVGLLRALLARAYNNGAQPGYGQKLQSASVYAPDRGILYKVINKPESLQAAVTAQIIANSTDVIPQPAQTEEISPALAGDVALSLTEQVPQLLIEENEAPFYVAEEASPETELQQAEVYDEDKYLPEAEQDEPLTYDEDKYLPVIEQQVSPVYYEQETHTGYDNDGYLPEPEEQPLIEPVHVNVFHEETGPHNIWEDKPAGQPGVTLAGSEIDDEVFDEITGIDDIEIEPASFKLIVQDGVIAREADEQIQDGDDNYNAHVLHEPIAAPETIITAPSLNLQDEEERLIIGNIAATNYFAFDKRFPGAEAKKAEETAADLPAVIQNKIRDDGRVTKYHDDKMPYSFMWWLDKTRREYADTYQPYAPYKQVNAQILHPAAPAELQKQYYENIFHLTTIENLDKQGATFDAGKKDDVLIERFIKEEPQIKPPSNDKLDNENKAKKSAEDQDELVSETLARIYMDQMLYHKAITTYKKLLLKFPEKSSYFVTQIELLERKIN